MKILLSEAAKADLAAIGDDIANDNPARARTFIRELRRAAARLGDTPKAFPLVPRYAHLGIRRRPFRNDLIFYQIESGQLVIVHIVHGARDYESLLFPEP